MKFLKLLSTLALGALLWITFDAGVEATNTLDF